MYSYKEGRIKKLKRFFWPYLFSCSWYRYLYFLLCLLSLPLLFVYWVWILFPFFYVNGSHYFQTLSSFRKYRTSLTSWFSLFYVFYLSAYNYYSRIILKTSFIIKTHGILSLYFIIFKKIKKWIMIIIK